LAGILKRAFWSVNGPIRMVRRDGNRTPCPGASALLHERNTGLRFPQPVRENEFRLDA